MQVNEIIQKNITENDCYVISQQCSDFILESRGLPLTKKLPRIYDNVQRVKVRKRKHIDGFSEAFNDAFMHEHAELRQRAIFANSTITESDELLENFYVFPINGYKFMYSRIVEQSEQDYKRVFETMFSQFGNKKSSELLSDLLQFTYSSVDLVEGMQSGAEIILYSVPYYYAVRRSAYSSYQDLLSYVTV